MDRASRAIILHSAADHLGANELIGQRFMFIIITQSGNLAARRDGRRSSFIGDYENCLLAAGYSCLFMIITHRCNRPTAQPANHPSIRAKWK
jgi:hypothetical protein